MKSHFHAATFPSFACALVLCASVRATDLLVDPTGAPGTFATIQAALVAAQPGDRILVQPGVYPSFSVTKSITILGMGSSVDAVVVAGIHLGLGFPNQHYHVSISRLRVAPGPLAPLAVSGQELGVGQIEFESVQIDGGFRLLSGEPGFVLSLANCSVVGTVGQGFDGATCHVASPAPSTFSITRCQFQGAPGDLFVAQPPLAGLLLDRGVTAQIAQCVIRGGNGGLAQAGAPGLDVRQAQVRSLGTMSTIRGGDGGAGACGGPGVLTTSTVFYGSATVTGGPGSPNGPVAAGTGTLLPSTGTDPELQVAVNQTMSGPVLVGSGTHLAWHLASAGAPALVLVSPAIGNPLPPPLDQLLIDPASSILMATTLDLVLPSFGAFVGLPLFGQGVSLDVAHNTLLATAPFALHLDH
ncbi:MAG TPA: hypothetical protein VFZ65_10735 [Planctomycetota bacterium]|nr:hypothetical protein [Planctomycetota bacterium]